MSAIKMQSEVALERALKLGPICPDDDAETKRRKWEALWALSDALIAEGMETWDEDRVREELGRDRQL